MEKVVKLRCTSKSMKEAYEYGKEYVAKEYTDSEGDLVFDIECTGDVFTVYKDSNGFSYKTWFELVGDDVKKVEEKDDVTMQDVARMLEVMETGVDVWLEHEMTHELVYSVGSEDEIRIPDELMDKKVRKIEVEKGLLIVWLKEEA